MHEFLAANRQELERRCREKVLQRPHRDASPRQLEQGIPLFIDQLISTLKAEADEMRVSINALCISKLMKLIDGEGRRDLTTPGATRAVQKEV